MLMKVLLLLSGPVKSTAALIVEKLPVVKETSRLDSAKGFLVTILTVPPGSALENVTEEGPLITSTLSI